MIDESVVSVFVENLLVVARSVEHLSVVGGRLSVISGSVEDLSVDQLLVVSGRWVGGEPVGRSLVDYRWSVVL